MTLRRPCRSSVVPWSEASFLWGNDWTQDVACMICCPAHATTTFDMKVYGLQLRFSTCPVFPDDLSVHPTQWGRRYAVLSAWHTLLNNISYIEHVGVRSGARDQYVRARLRSSLRVRGSASNLAHFITTCDVLVCVSSYILS